LKSLLIHKWLLIVVVIYTLFQVGRVYREESSRLLKEPIDSWLSDSIGDCAVVLTGGAGRLKEGFDLLVRGQVQKLVISGVNPQANIRELFPQMLLFPRIHESDIILEKRSETTYGNAQQSLPLVEALNCKSILLVTSYLHMYRARKTFRATYPRDISVIPYAVSGSHLPPAQLEVLVEATKSLFYSIWAF
jgi:uncharacterized SAM-binding protein YcdF (DUF218 family)